ncbi:hypothetical protein OOT33_13965 [Sphingobium sp. DEHP117]|uniref:c-type cytochrome n=1 Tax=Sphingobium sp. DEHP117 TaxID=2993436 RepID=UPI0027D5BFBC|nr:c-type cytochrome [Sphingobium sp. DEHP117]MDQ4421529.1 hypothetical protein [Sphingobium sp. DEHP117]
MKTTMNLWALSLSVLAVACSGSEKAQPPQGSESSSEGQVPAVNVSNLDAGDAASNAAAPAKAAPEEATKKEEKAAAESKDATKPATAIAAAAPAPVAPEPPKAEVAPPSTFARCAVCHDASKGGEDKLGPNLYGVFGMKAAKHRPGFNYSAALKNSGLVWNEANLDKWLTKPMEMVPGTTMSFPGLKDPAKRQELIDYLKSLK